VVVKPDQSTQRIVMIVVVAVAAGEAIGEVKDLVEVMEEILLPY